MMTRQRSLPMVMWIVAAQAAEAFRQGHAVAVEHHAGEEALDARLVEAVAAVEDAARLHVVGVAVEHREIGGEPLAVRHPRAQAPFLGDPARAAGVVRMEMRDDELPDRLAAEELGPDRLDQLALLLAAVAAVDHGPAVAVAQQPEIDLLQADERHRRRHPEDAVGDLDGLARRREVREREHQPVDHVAGLLLAVSAWLRFWRFGLGVHHVTGHLSCTIWSTFRCLLKRDTATGISS